MNRRTRWVIFGLAVVLAGCSGSAGREQHTKEVIAVDPTFSAVLDRHRRLLNRLEAYDREFGLKRLMVERTISQLRQDLAATKRDITQRKAQLKSEMDPVRAGLMQDMAEARAEIAGLGLQRSTIGGWISKIKKAMLDAHGAWPAEEHAHQQAELEQMLQTAHRMESEIEVLKNHIRILELKIELIRL